MRPHQQPLTRITDQEPTKAHHWLVQKSDELATKEHRTHVQHSYTHGFDVGHFWANVTIPCEGELIDITQPLALALKHKYQPEHGAYLGHSFTSAEQQVREHLHKLGAPFNFARGGSVRGRETVRRRINGQRTNSLAREVLAYFIPRAECRGVPLSVLTALSEGELAPQLVRNSTRSPLRRPYITVGICGHGDRLTRHTRLPELVESTIECLLPATGRASEVEVLVSLSLPHKGGGGVAGVRHVINGVERDGLPHCFMGDESEAHARHILKDIAEASYNIHLYHCVTQAMKELRNGAGASATANTLLESLELYELRV